ncbi:MAG: hypothetical protein B6I24_01320 [Bacteroidetes bacterium 4572_128]|nr:MAG: hypothetical protein B6I24_01320 [Bacteroidetes bacterium 4572_128]
MHKKQKNYIYYIIISIILITFFLNFLLVNFERNAENGNIDNIANAYWYMIVTLTTVGYGDFYPVTALGRAIGYLYVLSSLGFLGFLISNLTNKIMEFMEKKKLGYFGTSFTNHIVIIGWNEFGKQVAEQIVRADHSVAVVTNDKANIDLILNSFSKKNIFPFFSDYENFENLKKANINQAFSVFLNFNDDTENLVYLLNFKKHYKNVRLIAALNNFNLRDTFLSAGAAYAVSKVNIISKLVASYIFEPDAAKITEDIMTTSTEEGDFDMQEYKVIEKNPYLNKNCLEVFTDMKIKFNCVLLALSRKNDNGERIVLKNPSKETKIKMNDYIILISDGKSKESIIEAFGVKEGRF